MAQLIGVHIAGPHLFGPPPPHVSPGFGQAVCPGGQQSIVPPQPSDALPQSKPCIAHVIMVVQVGLEHVFIGVPGRLQTSPAGQVPHWRMPLHPSLMAPHTAC
jgi:hypothetical protein